MNNQIRINDKELQLILDSLYFDLGFNDEKHDELLLMINKLRNIQIKRGMKNGFSECI